MLLYWLTAAAPECAQQLSPITRQAAVTLPTRITALDSANGFRQFTFGTRLSDWPTPLSNIRVTKHRQLTAALPAEPVIIGDLIVRGINCQFYNGRLVRLDFAPTSEAYTEELLRVLQAQYGTGQPAGYEQVVWPGQVVTLVYNVLATNRGTGQRVFSTRQGQASLYSNALMAEMKAAKAGK